MILVDTSVWIDHLRRADQLLVGLLERLEVVAHPLVIEELAMGTVANRLALLDGLAALRGGFVLSHDELSHFVEVRSLWGRGLSPVDAQLLGSAMLSDGSLTIWTRDKALKAAATEFGVAYDSN